MNRANIFISASWIGLAGMVIGLVGSQYSNLATLAFVGTLTTVFACITMLITRNADEYTRGLWNSGASMAFAVMLILLLGLPFAEGVYDGFHGLETGRDIPAIVGSFIAVGAFYLGFFVKHLRGGL